MPGHHTPITSSLLLRTVVALLLTASLTACGDSSSGGLFTEDADVSLTDTPDATHDDTALLEDAPTDTPDSSPDISDDTSDISEDVLPDAPDLSEDTSPPEDAPHTSEDITEDTPEDASDTSEDVTEDTPEDTLTPDAADDDSDASDDDSDADLEDADPDADLEDAADDDADPDADLEDAADDDADDDTDLDADLDVDPEDAADDDADLDADPDADLDAPTDPDADLDATGDADEDVTDDLPDTAPPGGFVTIRIMAANTTSGDFQSYDPGHGIRIFQGLDPDIVLIQEFNYNNNTTSDIRRFVDLAFGDQFHYYREPGGNGTLPNGVISRWPIVDAGVWEDSDSSNREFAWARLDIPGPTDLWAVSVHLLTRSAIVRDGEANELVAHINANVPAEDFLVLGGDFNTDEATESALTTFQQIVSFQHIPVDHNGNRNTNQTRGKPYDWLLPDSDLSAYHTHLVIGEQSFPTGLVFDSRIYTPLTDVVPVLMSDSGAPSMQHMAVIKQFFVPGDP